MLQLLRFSFASFLFVFVEIAFLAAEDIETYTSNENGLYTNDPHNLTEEERASTVNNEPTNYNVQFLNLSWKNIEEICDTNVQNYTQLTLLDLSGNPLTTIEPLSSITIKELKIEHGHLRKIKGLDKLPNLINLSLAYNRHLTILDVPHISLSIIDISHSGVTQLNLKQLPNITKFIASNNRIISFDESTFGSNRLLETLDLSHNEISHIDDYSFIRNNKLKILNLANNKIVTLDWTLPLKFILNLNLSHNFISNIDLLLLRNVVSLDVSDNLISTLPENLERLLPSLTILDAHSNSIRVIKNLKSSVINSLNLRDCKLQELSADTFLGTPNLQHLDISDNKLQYLDFVMHLQNNSNVVLSGNLWNCQCNLTTRVNTLCTPSGLTYAEFCGLRANLTNGEYKPWFLHAANPVFWAPPIVALSLLVGGCFGLRAYRRCKARVAEEEPNSKSMDLLQNTGEDKFDDEQYKKLLRDRLSRRHPLRRISSLSSDADTEP